MISNTNALMQRFLTNVLEPAFGDLAIFDFFGRYTDVTTAWKS